MGSGLITKVQTLSITIPTGATSATGTITAVNTALSAVFFNGCITNNTGTVTQSNDFVGVTLTNGTTVTANRGVSNASFTATVNVTVVTFAASAIKSIQQGTIAITAAGTSNTGTITSVTTTNACCLCNGYTVGANIGSVASALLAVTLTNATTVTANRGGTNGSTTAVAYYTIIEFASGILNSSTQAGTISVTTTTNTATITAVTAGQAMVIWGGTTSNDTTNAGYGASLVLSLTNGTTVTATANGTVTGSTTSIAHYTIIEFKAAAIKSVNRGTITIAVSATTGTASITAVNTAYAIPNFTGFSSESGAANANDAIGFTDMTLTNSTTVTATRNTSSGSFTNNCGWEVIEHNPYAPPSGMFLCM